MAAYNSWNGTPMMVHPVLKKVMIKEWGNDGIICTDGGALGLLITDHKSFPNKEHAPRRRSRRVPIDSLISTNPISPKRSKTAY